MSEPLKIDSSNLLFDLVRIRCEWVFVNKTKHWDYFESLKQNLISQVNEIPSDTFEPFPQKFYLSYNDRNIPKTNNQLHLCSDCNIVIYISNDDKSKRDKIIDIFKAEKAKYIKLLMICEEKDIWSNTKEIKYFNKDKSSSNIIDEIKDIWIAWCNEYCKDVLNKSPFPVNSKYSKDNIEKKKEVKQRCEEYLQIQKYDIALDIINKAISSYSDLEEYQWKEIKAITLFHKDITSIDRTVRELNDDIVSLFENVGKKYEKFNRKDLKYDTSIRWLIYYTYFNINDYKREFHEIIMKLVEDIKTQSLEIKFVLYLQLANIHNKIRCYRKENLYLHFAWYSCFGNENLEGMVPYMITRVSNNFLIFNASTNTIDTREQFDKIHKLIWNYRKKPLLAYVSNKGDNGKFKELVKKRFEKGSKLEMRNILNQINKFIFRQYWDKIQTELFFQIMNFYEDNPNKTQENMLQLIKFKVGYLQTLYSIISAENQEKIIQSHKDQSLSLQKKIILNWSKIPILMRIIPLTSEIKFDISNNTKFIKPGIGENIFWYNPWEKSNIVNYYWTKYSSQNIKVQFYNPWKVEIIISKILILFSGVQPLSYPSSISIAPNSSVFITCKIRPWEDGITDIIGLSYEIVNNTSIQYVDENGNGLFYNFENVSEDSLNWINDTKEIILLKKIKIYPEIPCLDFKVLDNSFEIINGCIDWYEYQYYNFSFWLDNVGSYPINEINCYIYAYKKDDYKVSLDEINWKKAEINGDLIPINTGYIFNYKYLHKNYHKKIEFRWYYISYSKNKKSEIEEELLIKPYWYYSKLFSTWDLIQFSDKRIIPMVSSGSANDLAKIDYWRVNKKYSFYFCSENHYLSFILENSHENPMKISIVNNTNNMEKLWASDTCEGYKRKEISFVIDSNADFSKLYMDWKFSNMDNCTGKIDMNIIFSSFNISAWLRFSFKIEITNESEKGIECCKCVYKVKNNTSVKKENLKLFIYLYQKCENDDDNYVFNAMLKPDIFYNGSLTVFIKELEGYEEFSYEWTVYPINGEILNTTCLLVDKENKSVFMSPESKKLFLP